MMDEVWTQLWVTGTVVYDCFPLTVSYAQKQANHAYAEYMLCISIFFFLMFGALFTAAHGHADELVYVLLPVILCVMACTSGDKRLKHCTKMTLFIVYGILGCIGLAFSSLILIAMDNQEMNGMLAAMVLHLCCTIWTWMNSEDMDFADENYSIQSIQEPMIRDIERGAVIASARSIVTGRGRESKAGGIWNRDCISTCARASWYHARTGKSAHDKISAPWRTSGPTWDSKRVVHNENR